MKISTLLGKEMSPLGLLLLLFLQHTGFAGAALGYVLFTHSARMGSNTTIPCKFDVNAVPPAQRTFSVIWHFQGKEIFKYPNNPGVLNSRLSIDQDRIKDGTADLYMSGVSISDGGLYKCSMTEIPGEKEKEIRLDVYAPPRITITGKNINMSKENVLTCAISGFYPVDIDIKWLRDGIILNNVTLEKPQRDPDGMYSVRSSVTIIPTEKDRKRTFSCRIQHESLPAPLQEEFKLLYGDTTSSTLIIIIPVAAGVILIIIIAVVAILCVKRKGKNNHNKVKNQENQEETLMSSNLQEEDHVPKKPQDYNKNPKSATERINKQDKSLINYESSVAALSRREEDHLLKKTQDYNKNPKGATERSNKQEKSLINDESSVAALSRREDHLPKEPQDYNKNPKSAAERSNKQDKSLINDESSVAALSRRERRNYEDGPRNSLQNSPMKFTAPMIKSEIFEKQIPTPGHRGGVNSAKSAAEDRTREIRSPGYKKTTSEAVSPGPRDTRLFINKETEPSNQENTDDKRVRVAELVKQIEANEKKMKP